MKTTRAPFLRSPCPAAQYFAGCRCWEERRRSALPLSVHLTRGMSALPPRRPRRAEEDSPISTERNVCATGGPILLPTPGLLTRCDAARRCSRAEVGPAATEAGQLPAQLPPVGKVFVTSRLKTDRAAAADSPAAPTEPLRPTPATRREQSGVAVPIAQQPQLAPLQLPDARSNGVVLSCEHIPVNAMCLRLCLRA